ncbi:MAG: AAA family ATPase [Acidobacteria bacterium]|nr:AAA family ATPase [Acidobacteriota bacterium]
MIRELVVSNYRSLGPGITVEPGRLSVLIGPNGSGKSNVLRALTFIRNAVIQGLPAAVTHENGIDSVRRRSSGRPFDVHFRLGLLLADGPATYEFVITGDRLEEYRVKTESAFIEIDGVRHEFHRQGNRWSGPEGIGPRMDDQSLALTALGGTEQFKPLVDFLAGMTVYSIFPDILRAPQKFDPARPMREHGENWVSILREMVKNSGRKMELLRALGKLTGDIEDVRVTSAAGHLIAEFKQQIRTQKGKRWFDAAQQSDGTLRVAGLLTALLQEPNVPVIGIEEPELTVHPGVLPLLYDYLRQAASVSQVLVTTHSPILLDLLDVDQDTIFVVNRIDGKTNVKRVGDDQIKPVRNSLLSLGDLFLSGDLQLSLYEESEKE